MRTYRVIELDILRWATDRKIIPNSTSYAQVTKLDEEADETLDAAKRLKLYREAGMSKDDPLYIKAVADFKDGVADCVICLINACALEDVDLVECLEGGYGEIKNRKGTLGKDGIFVKQV
jgi:hypothetical protein